MPAPALNPVKRLISLDVVRGITIAFMIMVNNNGGPGSWRFMNHATWNGLTPTDLVFPTFVFVVGVSVVFAFDARLARGAARRCTRRRVRCTGGSPIGCANWPTSSRCPSPPRSLRC